MFYIDKSTNQRYDYIPTATIAENILQFSTYEESETYLNSVKDQEFNELSYSEKRKLSYPPIEDYIDGIVKGDTSQVQDYINKCLAIKAKYSKV